MIETEIVPQPQKVTLLGATTPLPKAACIKLACGIECAQRDAARLADDLLTIAGVPTTIGGQCGWPIAMRIHGEDLRPQYFLKYSTNIWYRRTICLK